MSGVLGLVMNRVRVKEKDVNEGIVARREEWLVGMALVGLSSPFLHQVTQAGNRVLWVQAIART